ncbi:MAG: response regulator [Herbaspirillum sp.]|nr:response regulator [Herbaspirillum sp.]
MMTSSTATNNVPGLETSVRIQAKVRVTVGFPVLLLGLVAVRYWGTPYGANGLVAVGVIATLHTLYMFTTFWLATRIRQRSTARALVIGTAILDPLLLSGWLTMTGETGALFVCFYLFTILGFGFRTGRRSMWICQAASLAGFAMVLAIAPVWRAHPTLGLSLFAILVVVPLYATGLIKNLRDAHARAEFESQAKSQLLAKVSHELRTPLSGIVASAQLIAAEATDARVIRRADIVLRLSNDLLLEINDLLDSAKSEAKALMLASTLFDLHDVMDQIRLTFASMAATKDIDFNVTVDRGIEKMVQGDAHYLSRVLKNLVGNAVKFTDVGKVDVNLQLLENHDDVYRIRFSVQDTGIGIPRELHRRIFEPFYQVSDGTTRQYGGTGLGMSLAREVVTLMGSEIIVQSELGKGSLFYFDADLPVVAKAHQESADGAPPAVLYGKRILVADDNTTNLILIQELLKQDRHAVAIADSGENALNLLNEQIFDVIFMDYNMGDMDGGQVLHIYQFGKLETAPVFFLTADTTASTSAKLRDIGAAGVLHKPVSRDELRQAIVQACGTDGMQAQSRPELTSVKPPPAPLTSIPPQYLDLAVLGDLQTCSPRPEFFAQILRSATLDMERNCRGLLEALAAEDIEQVHDTAHALSGISDTVGAVRLASLASKLMRIDRWELHAAREHWTQEVTQTTNRSVRDLDALLQTQTTIH